MADFLPDKSHGTLLRVTDHELELLQPVLDIIRGIETLETEFLPKNEREKRLLENQTILAQIVVDGNFAIKEPITAATAEIELAQIGQRARKKIIEIARRRWTQEVQANGEDEADSQQSGDSILGTQPRAYFNVEPMDESDESESEVPFLWEQVRKRMPSYVKGVKFVVDKEDMTQENRDELKQQFPTVTMCRERETGKAIAPLPPAGADTESEVTSLVETGPTTPSFKSITSLSDNKQSVTDARTANGLEFKVDLPADIRRGIYVIEIDDNFRDEKLYSQLQSYFPLASIRRGSIAPSRVKNLTIDTSAYSAHRASPDSDTPDNLHQPLSSISTPSAPKSLAERMTRDRFNIRGAATSSPIPHSQPSFTSLVSRTTFSKQGQTSMQQNQSPRSKAGVHDALDSIVSEIDLPPTNIEHLRSMYEEWLGRRRVRGFFTRYNLSQYYCNLVDLYIVGHHTGDDALAIEAFKQWQRTTYQYTKHSPPIEAAIKPFGFLPHDSPLCQWIVKWFAYMWPTSGEGSYEEMREHVVQETGASADAIGAFLFDVCELRCAHVRGGDVPLLEDWCTWHDHKGATEQEQCEQERDSLLDLEEARKEVAKEAYKDAMAAIRDYQRRYGGIAAASGIGGKRKSMTGSPTGTKRSKSRVGR